jgi:hypothetical protein
MAPPDTYMLGRGEAETRRLILQDRIHRPLTRRVFEAPHLAHSIGARRALYASG